MRLLRPFARPEGGRKRRRAAPPRLGRSLATAAAVLAVAGAGVGLGWAWRSGAALAAADALRRGVIALSIDAGLVVRDVLVVGRRETPSAAILEALAVERGTPLLLIDLETARERLAQIAWVAEADIERRLPDTVYVRIVERRPMALWQDDGRFLLVDDEGTVLLRRGVERFAHLPVIVGDGAPRHARRLLDQLAAEPDLEARVRSSIRIADRRWNLALDNGIEVRLPEGDAGAAIAELARLQREHDLLSRDVVAIDLRQPSRLVVQVGSEPAPRAPKHTVAKRPGKST